MRHERRTQLTIDRLAYQIRLSSYMQPCHSLASTYTAYTAVGLTAVGLSDVGLTAAESAAVRLAAIGSTERLVLLARLLAV